MQIVKIILWIVLLTGLHSKDIKWHMAETIEMYALDQNSVFNLKDHVAYLEIRWEEKGNNEYMIIKKVPLDSFGTKIVKQFHDLKPKYSAKANLLNKGNAFFIDDKGKIWQMDMIEDVMSLLGDIDTPAEAQLVLWLHRGCNAKEYSRTSKGYKMLVEEHEGKKCYLDEIFISKKGKLSSKSMKLKCQKIAKKQSIKNQYIKYRMFTDIVIDKNENIYLLGWANDTRSNNADVVTIDKYNRNGKKVWQKILRGDYAAQAEKIVLDSNYLYLLDTSNRDYFIVQYSTSGELISRKAYDGSDKQYFETIYKHSNKNKIKETPYYRNISDKEIHFTAQARSKTGNTYVVGEEIEEIPQKPEDIPIGECGMGDELHGAFIVKFNKRGNQVWSKVIDLKW